MQLFRALRVAPNQNVAFVGGGGKTTAMFGLALELAHQKMRVLVTTTTRIFAAQINLAPAHLTFNPQQQTVADILPQLDAAIEKYNQVLLIGQADAASGKAFGLPPEIIDQLAASGHFDIILNEADGSRMRPFKAPARHEPVIPASTSLVVPVVGLDVVGQPLTDQSTHRPELISRLSDTPLNQPVSVDTVTSVLCHAQGGLKNVPPAAQIIPLLNKAENNTRLAAAQKLAAQLLTCPQIEAVAIGSVHNTDNPVLEVRGRTAAVVLAAGGSSRFGSPKQLARWGDKTFIERAVDTALASQAGPVVVVLGAEVEQSRALLKNRPVQIVVNKKWAEGQSTSMQAGLAALPPNVTSAIFLLIDLPGLTPAIINALIKRHRQTLAPIVWPEVEGKRGNPVLFDKALFGELMQVSGDTGGRPVLSAYKHQAERVVTKDARILRDIDRPEDLENSDDKEI